MKELLIGFFEVLVVHKKEVVYAGVGYSAYLVITQHQQMFLDFVNFVSWALYILVSFPLIILLVFIIIKLIMFMVETYNEMKQRRIKNVKQLLLSTDFGYEPIVTISRRFMRFTKEPLRALVITLELVEKYNRLPKEILEYKLKPCTPTNLAKVLQFYRNWKENNAK